jgi:hypothetical protein
MQWRISRGSVEAGGFRDSQRPNFSENESQIKLVIVLIQHGVEEIINFLDFVEKKKTFFYSTKRWALLNEHCKGKKSFKRLNSQDGVQGLCINLKKFNFA